MGKTYQITESELLALKEIDEYLSQETYEKGKPVHLNYVGAYSILHQKLKNILSNLKEVEQVVGLKWVKASERLPEKCGEENSVIIRGNVYDLTGYEATFKPYGNRKFVTYGFRNFSESNPQIYFSIGNHSFLHNSVEWLEEYTAPVSVVGGIDWEGLEKEAKEYFPAAAKEYATKQGGHDKPHITAWDFVSGVDSVLSWLKTNLPKYYTAPVNTQK